VQANEPLTVSIADDHLIVLRALGDLLANQPDFAVVSYSRDGEAALEAIFEYRPRIALVDLQMPKRNGLQILAEVRRLELSTSVVLFTAGLSDVQLFDAVTAGAAGIVLKEIAPEALIECLREVGRGKQWITPTLVGPAMVREAARRQKWHDLSALLTPRESEIVGIVAKGGSNKDIAYRLAISEGTLKVHLNRIFRKLDVASRNELIDFASAQGGLGLEKVGRNVFAAHQSE
jgi:two-component system, NarL family, nitrate/nitrite response regulator NarL